MKAVLSYNEAYELKFFTNSKKVCVCVYWVNLATINHTLCVSVFCVGVGVCAIACTVLTPHSSEKHNPLLLKLNSQ